MAQSIMNDKPSVVVVGAGISGLEAACSLHRNGFHVTLVEAETRVGGRIFSMYHGDEVTELGAQWIHGQQGNQVYQFAKDNDLLNSNETVVSDDEKAGLYCTNTGYVIDDDLVRITLEKLDEIKDRCSVPTSQDSSSIEDIFRVKFEEFKSALLKSSQDISCQTETNGDDYIDTLCNLQLCNVKVTRKFTADDFKYMDALLEWYFIFEKIDNACDTLSSLSIRAYSDYIDCPGHSLLTMPQGYSSITNCLLRNMPAEAVLLSHQVTHVSYGPECQRVIIKSKCHSSQTEITLQADHCILTVSLGVLKNRTIQFDPPLPPAKVNLIDSLGFGTINKIFLQFDKCFWPVKSSFAVKLIWMKGDKEKCNYPPWVYDMTGFDECKSAKATLVGWIGGQGARDIESLTSEMLADTCHQLLMQFLGTKSIEKPKKVLLSKWHSNENFRGAYSHPTKESESLSRSNGVLGDAIEIDVLNSRKAVPRLIIAGEATDPEYFSTTHGAFRSGERAAQRLIDFVSKNDSSNG